MQGIVTLLAGDTLALTNVSGVSFAIDPSGNGSTGNNTAFLTLVQIQ